MSLECWYYVAGIGSFLVAGGGLAGLVVYALDTRKLRLVGQEHVRIAQDQIRLAQEQVELANRPCVLLMRDAENERPLDQRGLYFKNVGSGVALNIRWRYPGDTWAQAPALAPGEPYRPGTISEKNVLGKGVVCEFTSLSGRVYQSTAIYTDEPEIGLELRHKFDEIPEQITAALQSTFLWAGGVLAAMTLLRNGIMLSV